METFPASVPAALAGELGKGTCTRMPATVRDTKSQASCAQAGTFVSFAHYGNKSASYKAVGTSPTHLFTIHIWELYQQCWTV